MQQKQMNTTIAECRPFSGPPCINTPAVYGASPGRPFLYRIPVTGKRPVTVKAAGLPEGLVLDDEGIITGSVSKEGVYTVRLSADNSLGNSARDLTVEIAKGNVLATPLMGFCSWNAFRCLVTRDDILSTAEAMRALGISEYGYDYINIDSSWQGRYGGKYDAVMPNEKFPDMKGLVSSLHKMGFHCGIYASPMMLSWGNFADFPRHDYPGVTRGPRDIRFADTMGGIGLERCEENNVRQWEEWGIDYLKYDWGPTDTVNADIMRKALDKASRDIGFCVTVWADFPFRDYWSKYTNSWRCQADADCDWQTFLEVIKDSDRWLGYIGKNHFYDLDMLEVGYYDDSPCGLTEDEQITAFSMRIVFNSPIQFSCRLDHADPFLLALLCNPEVISVGQDIFSAAELVDENKNDRTYTKEYHKKLTDGRVLLAFFNIGEKRETFNLSGTFRDIWARSEVTLKGLTLEPHCCRLLKTI